MLTQQTTQPTACDAIRPGAGRRACSTPDAARSTRAVRWQSPMARRLVTEPMPQGLPKALAVWQRPADIGIGPTLCWPRGQSFALGIQQTVSTVLYPDGLSCPGLGPLEDDIDPWQGVSTRTSLALLSLSSRRSPSRVGRRCEDARQPEGEQCSPQPGSTALTPIFVAP